MLVNTFELPFEQRKDYLDRMINLGVLSLREGELVGPSLKFIDVFGNVVKNPGLREQVIKDHDPDLARMIFCCGALIDFIDRMKEEEIFHMLNVLSDFFNFPPLGTDNYKNFMKWLVYYYK